MFLECSKGLELRGDLCVSPAMVDLAPDFPERKIAWSGTDRGYTIQIRVDVYVGEPFAHCLKE